MISVKPLTSSQSGSEDAGGGATMPMELTLRPVAWLRFPEMAACPRLSAMLFISVKTSSSKHRGHRCTQMTHVIAIY